MAKKRHLLDVLREQDQRSAEPPSAQAKPVSPARSLPALPPQLWPILGGLCLLILLSWGGCAFFGGSSEPSAPDPAVAKSGILVRTYLPSRLEQARKEATALQKRGYDVALAQVEDPSGSPQLQLFVGPAASSSELEPLLQEIQALSLDGQPTPFAGASIHAWPQSP